MEEKELRLMEERELRLANYIENKVKEIENNDYSFDEIDHFLYQYEYTDLYNDYKESLKIHHLVNKLTDMILDLNL